MKPFMCVNPYFNFLCIHTVYIFTSSWCTFCGFYFHIFIHLELKHVAVCWLLNQIINGEFLFSFFFFNRPWKFILMVSFWNFWEISTSVEEVKILRCLLIFSRILDNEKKKSHYHLAKKRLSRLTDQKPWEWHQCWQPGP